MLEPRFTVQPAVRVKPQDPFRPASVSAQPSYDSFVAHFPEVTSVMKTQSTFHPAVTKFSDLQM